MDPRRAPKQFEYAVVGHPVEHSLSPPMQRAAFEALGLRVRCGSMDVPPDRLAEALDDLYGAGMDGLNVTAPHKEDAWELAEDVTEEAEAVGAVNTLRRGPWGWHGHNTDGPGFRDWLEVSGIGLRRARVLLLGAGGAARGILPALGPQGAASLVVVSRDVRRAEEAAKVWSGLGYATPCRASALGDRAQAAAIEPADVLIRALASDRIEAPEELWWGRLAAQAPVVDLNYGARARFSRMRAAAEGRPFEDGLGLLLHQGALSFEFWTGKPAPIEAMRKALAEAAG